MTPTSIEDRLRSLREDGPDLGDVPPPGLAGRVSARIDGRASAVRRQRRALAGGIVAAVVLAAGVTVGVRGGDGDDHTQTSIATPRTGAIGWMLVSRSPLKERSGAVAVSMGGPVLVFGGYDRGRTLPNGHLVEDEAHRAAVYDPQKGSWRSVTPPPDRFRYGDAVWTGDLVYLMDQQERLYSYDPAEDHWARLAPLPVEHGGSRKLVWTGQQLLAFDATGQPRRTVGATYDADRDRWTVGPGTDLAVQMQWAQWTGSAVVMPSLAQGSTVPEHLGPLLSFTPERGWERLSTPPLAEAATRTFGYAGWTGTELVIGGGSAWSETELANARTLALGSSQASEAERAAAQPHPTDDAVAWNPATGLWRPIATLAPAHLPPYTSTSVWTGTELLVLPDNTVPDRGVPPLLLLDPVTGVWRTADPPPGGSVLGAATAWTGAELFQFGGSPVHQQDGREVWGQPSTTGRTFTP